jgi:NADPH2:quinone reductase
MLRLSLREAVLTAPEEDEIIVRVEAAPINPSDIGLLVGPGDLSTLRSVGSDERPVLLLDIPDHRKASVAARIDRPLVVGNQGAGTVIAAGTGCQALLEKRIGMYADFRKIKAKDIVGQGSSDPV